MANRTTVTINGIDLTEYVTSYTVNDEINDDYSSCSIEFNSSVMSYLNVAEEMEIIITRYLYDLSQTTIFRGFVSNITNKFPQYLVDGYDKIWKLNRKLINYSYDADIDPSAGVISKIAFDLAVTRGGLDGTYGVTFQDSGTVNLLSKYICRKSTYLERIKLLLVETLNWQFYYNPSEDKCFAEPKGTTMFTDLNFIYGGPNSNVRNTIQWKEDRENMINQVEVIGESSEVETIELFSGDGLENEFQLTKIPVSVKVTVGGVVQVGGKPDSTPTYDYYVDYVNSKIIFLVASTPPVGVDNVQIDYSYYEPINISRKNSDSISKFGLYEARKVFKDVITVDDAIQRSNKILEIYSYPIFKTDLDIDGIYNIRAGMKINLTDNFNTARSGDYVVRSVIYRYPEFTDTLNIVSSYIDDEKFLTSLRWRLKRLEDENIKTQELITTLEDIEHFDYVKRRYLDVVQRPIGNSFIIGHSTNGVIGTSTLGENYGTDVTVRRVWPNNTYTEEFYDEDFKDSGTALWNTTYDTANNSGRLQYA